MLTAAVFALGIGGVLAQGAQSEVATEIASLDLSRISQGWGTPQRNRSVDKRPLTIGGRTFERGLGTHAQMEFRISLHGAANRFSATVGVDDEVQEKGSVEFIVYVDGKKAWSSGVLRGTDGSKDVTVRLEGARSLRLVVDEAGNNEYDHADWADAVIYGKPSGKRPAAEIVPIEPGMKIASGVSPKPELHGPRVVGCTPGMPFLFRIPASGTRPLRFAVQGLPAGLKLDSAKGILTGSVAKAGTYRVAVQVSNKLGKDQRELKIVAGRHKLAMTPPMGWNSWNVWGVDVTANRVRDAARLMDQSGLADFGYQYVNIDDAWESSRDESGELGTNAKFGDMAKLAQEVHALGLKLGIYSSPGPKTCANYEGSYKHELQDARMWARWGIDYVKYDWCSYGSIAKNGTLLELQKPYLVMREALDQCGRDIVYSLCQYGMGEVWNWGNVVGGDLWRTTGDITDTWNSMAGIGFAHSDKAHGASPSGWNDPDMLVVGYLGWSSNIRKTRLTQNEQITHITLWSMLAAPLILGCDFTKLDQFTKDLLMNHDVIEVDQDPLGKAARRVLTVGECEVWMRPLFDGSKAVALFNRGSSKAKCSVTWKALKIAGKPKVRDLWLRKDLGVQPTGLSREVPAHGAMLFKVD